MDHRNRTVLHFAAHNGSPAMVRVLLAHGDADITIKDDEGHTPREVALNDNFPEVAKLLE